MIAEIFGTFLESLESVILGDEVGDEVHLGEHVHGLGLNDGHQHLGATGLNILDGFLHSIEAALIHEGDQSHADNDNLGIGRNGLHHLLELVDGTEEDGAVKTLNINLMRHGVRHTVLIVPRALLVEIGAFLPTLATLDEVRSALHKEYTCDDHTNTHSGEKVDKDGD